jgi:hypothetical protein
MATSEEIRKKVENLQEEFGDFQETILMTHVQDELQDMESTLSLLPGKLKRLRKQGYVFQNYLENKLEVLTKQWQTMRGEVNAFRRQRVRELEREAEEVEETLQAALRNPGYHHKSAETALTALEDKIEAARSALTGMYETLQTNIRQTDAQIKDIQWLFEQIDTASFDLYPAEDPLIASKAELLRENQEERKGVLYLTDERILFEQKEKVAKKKILFIATEKETVQNLVFEVPVGQIEDVSTSQAGLFKGREILELAFSADSDLSSARLRLRGSQNEEWSRLIGRVKSGEIAQERTRPKDQKVVEAAQKAPTKCPSCGATLEVEIVRGMREITCEYCGSVIRL